MRAEHRTGFSGQHAAARPTVGQRMRQRFWRRIGVDQSRRDKRRECLAYQVLKFTLLDRRVLRAAPPLFDGFEA